MNIGKRLATATALVLVQGLVLSGHAAAEIQTMTINVIAAPSNVNAWKVVQKPFYEGLGEASGGKITVKATPHDVAGVGQVEASHMASDGVINIANISPNELAGDDPRFAGMDLPGIGVTVKDAQAAFDSYRAIADKALGEVEHLKLLAAAPNTMQVILCKGDITGLDYFRGKKVRVWAKAMGDYMTQLGSVTVTIPWEEAMPALQRGVADCGITSPSNANNAHWWEILNSQMVIPLGGWGIDFIVANRDWWDSLNDDTRAFLEEQFKKVEDRGWAQAGLDLQDGVDCNAGKDTCKFGIRATAGHEMKTVYPNDADMKLHAEIMRDSVLKEWATTCGTECVKQWNDTIGKTVGVVAPVP